MIESIRLVPVLAVGVAALIGCTEEKRVAPQQNEPSPTVAQPPTQAVSEVPPPREIPIVTLTSSTGDVEVMRDGHWQAATIGTLKQDDAVRSQRGGSATVSIGDTQVIVEERSEVTVHEMTQKIANLQLEQGRISADIAEQNFVLRIRAKGSSAIAESKTGAFSLFNNGRGLVAVATKTGRVKLSSAGGDTILEAGEQGHVADNAQPTKKTLQRSVLLSVNWPDARTEKARTMIRGRADVGARIAINGQTTDVDANGRFKATIPLTEGDNAIVVTATDLRGETKKETGQIRVKPKPPAAEAETDGLWK